MATKAELEAEIVALKKELEAGRTEKTAPAGVDTPVESTETAGSAESAADDKSTLDWVMSQFDGSELDRLFKEFAAELEDMQEQKPLMTLFGAFLLGYLLGRAR